MLNFATLFTLLDTMRLFEPRLSAGNAKYGPLGCFE
jgi:hypothetical protein